MTELEKRNEASVLAYKIVRKFPQIEQEVLAPLLGREIGIAFLELIDKAEEWRALNQRRVEALESVEWIMVKGRMQCPSCLESKDSGHGVLCLLDEALRPTSEKLKLREEQNAL